MKKVLIILLLIFVPCFVFAKKVSYDKSIDIAQNYFINSYKDYKKYLMNDNGELLTESEYNITNNNNNSYLNIGSDFWFKENNGSDKKETIVCNYVFNDVVVSGTGSYNNPWVFEELYKVSLISNNNDYGEINNSEQYVKKGEELNFSYNTKTGYKYRNIICNDSNDDNVEINKVNNTINIKNINSNINCKVSFELNTYTVTLNANGGTLPTNEGWKNSSTNETSTKEITYDTEYGNLATPIKTNYSFEGWYLENTYINKIESNTKLKTTFSHMLYANGKLIVHLVSIIQVTLYVMVKLKKIQHVLFLIQIGMLNF